MSSAPIATVSASPSSSVLPDHDWGRGALYASVSLLIGLTQGMGIYVVNNNLPSIQGAFSATAAEASWLSAAYFATNLSAISLLTKVRLQYGLRPFAGWGIAVFMLVSVFLLGARDLPSAIAVRAATGIAAAPLSTLAIFYMLEAFPKPLAPVALVLGFGTLQLGSPLSRIVAEHLLDTQLWRGLQRVDVALALASLTAIILVRLTPVPKQKLLCPGDLVSFILYSSSLALLAIVCTQGRTYWWTDTPWIGLCLAGSIALMGIYILVDLTRNNPLLDLRWIFKWSNVRFIVAVILFRIMLSEQPTGAVTFMNVLGFNNEQLHVLFGWVLFGTVLGFVLALLALPSHSFRLPGLIALVLIFIAALLDADSTSLTRPPDLYLSQTLIAIGTAMFLSSSLLIGFIPVIQEGMKNIVSFLAILSGSQTLGSLLGTAILSTFLADRQKLHYAQLTESLSLADPIVVQRIAQGTGAFGGVVVDAAQRRLQGVAALAQQVTRESFVLAYNDLFKLIAALAVLTFTWLAYVAIRAHQRNVASAQSVQATPAALPVAAV
jgi:MFS family permease